MAQGVYSTLDTSVMFVCSPSHRKK